MTPDLIDVIIGVCFALMRGYLIYWIYCGWFVVKKVGNLWWTIVYTLSSLGYLCYTSLSYLGFDAARPARFLAIIAMAFIVKKLVLAVMYREEKLKCPERKVDVCTRKKCCKENSNG